MTRLQTLHCHCCTLLGRRGRHHTALRAQPRHQARHQDHLRAQPEERRAPPRAYAPAVGPAPLIFLAPLAGIAALYAMAFVQQNPALLTLVTVSGRRKR